MNGRIAGDSPRDTSVDTATDVSPPVVETPPASPPKAEAKPVDSVDANTRKVEDRPAPDSPLKDPPGLGVRTALAVKQNTEPPPPGLKDAIATMKDRDEKAFIAALEKEGVSLADVATYLAKSEGKDVAVKTMLRFIPRANQKKWIAETEARIAADASATKTGLPSMPLDSTLELHRAEYLAAADAYQADPSATNKERWEKAQSALINDFKIIDQWLQLPDLSDLEGQRLLDKSDRITWTAKVTTKHFEYAAAMSGNTGDAAWQKRAATKGSDLHGWLTSDKVKLDAREIEYYALTGEMPPDLARVQRDYEEGGDFPYRHIIREAYERRIAYLEKQAATETDPKGPLHTALAAAKKTLAMEPQVARDFREGLGDRLSSQAERKLSRYQARGEPVPDDVYKSTQRQQSIADEAYNHVAGEYEDIAKKRKLPEDHAIRKKAADVRHKQGNVRTAKGTATFAQQKAEWAKSGGRFPDLPPELDPTNPKNAGAAYAKAREDHPKIVEDKQFSKDARGFNGARSGAALEIYDQQEVRYADAILDPRREAIEPDVSLLILAEKDRADTIVLDNARMDALDRKPLGKRTQDDKDEYVELAEEAATLGVMPHQTLANEHLAEATFQSADAAYDNVTSRVAGPPELTMPFDEYVKLEGDAKAAQDAKDKPILDAYDHTPPRPEVLSDRDIARLPLKEQAQARADRDKTLKAWRDQAVHTRDADEKIITPAKYSPEQVRYADERYDAKEAYHTARIGKRTAALRARGVRDAGTSIGTGDEAVAEGRYVLARADNFVNGGANKGRVANDVNAWPLKRVDQKEVKDGKIDAKLMNDPNDVAVSNAAARFESGVATYYTTVKSTAQAKRAAAKTLGQTNLADRRDIFFWQDTKIAEAKKNLSKHTNYESDPEGVGSTTVWYDSNVLYLDKDLKPSGGATAEYAFDTQADLDAFMSARQKRIDWEARQKAASDAADEAEKLTIAADPAAATAVEAALGSATRARMTTDAILGDGKIDPAKKTPPSTLDEKTKRKITIDNVNTSAQVAGMTFSYDSGADSDARYGTMGYALLRHAEDGTKTFLKPTAEVGSATWNKQVGEQNMAYATLARTSWRGRAALQGGPQNMDTGGLVYLLGGFTERNVIAFDKGVASKTQAIDAAKKAGHTTPVQLDPNEALFQTEVTDFIAPDVATWKAEVTNMYEISDGGYHASHRDALQFDRDYQQMEDMVGERVQKSAGFVTTYGASALYSLGKSIWELDLQWHNLRDEAEAAGRKRMQEAKQKVFDKGGAQEKYNFGYGVLAELSDFDLFGSKEGQRAGGRYWNGREMVDYVPPTATYNEARLWGLMRDTGVGGTRWTGDARTFVSEKLYQSRYDQLDEDQKKEVDEKVAGLEYIARNDTEIVQARYSARSPDTKGFAKQYKAYDHQSLYTKQTAYAVVLQEYEDEIFADTLGSTRFKLGSMFVEIAGSFLAGGAVVRGIGALAKLNGGVNAIASFGRGVQGVQLAFAEYGAVGRFAFSAAEAGLGVGVGAVAPHVADALGLDEGSFGRDAFLFFANTISVTAVGGAAKFKSSQKAFEAAMVFGLGFTEPALEALGVDPTVRKWTSIGLQIVVPGLVGSYNSRQALPDARAQAEMLAKNVPEAHRAQVMKALTKEIYVENAMWGSLLDENLKAKDPAKRAAAEERLRSELANRHTRLEKQMNESAALKEHPEIVRDVLANDAFSMAMRLRPMEPVNELDPDGVKTFFTETMPQQRKALTEELERMGYSHDEADAIVTSKMLETYGATLTREVYRLDKDDPAAADALREAFGLPPRQPPASTEPQDGVVAGSDNLSRLGDEVHARRVQRENGATALGELGAPSRAASWDGALGEALGRGVTTKALEQSVAVDVPGYSTRIDEVTVTQLPEGRRVVTVDAEIHGPNGELVGTVRRHMSVVEENGRSVMRVTNEDVSIDAAHRGKGLGKALAAAESRFHQKLADDLNMPVVVDVQAAAPGGVYYWARRGEGYAFKTDADRQRVSDQMVALTHKNGATVEHDGRTIALDDPAVQRRVSEQARNAKSPADFAEITVTVGGKEVPVGRLMLQQHAGKNGIGTWNGQKTYEPAAPAHYAKMDDAALRHIGVERDPATNAYKQLDAAKANEFARRIAASSEPDLVAQYIREHPQAGDPATVRKKIALGDAETTRSVVSWMRKQHQDGALLTTLAAADAPAKTWAQASVEHDVATTKIPLDEDVRTRAAAALESRRADLEAKLARGEPITEAEWSTIGAALREQNVPSDLAAVMQRRAATDIVNGHIAAGERAAVARKNGPLTQAEYRAVVEQSLTQAGMTPSKVLVDTLVSQRFRTASIDEYGRPRHNLSPPDAARFDKLWAKYGADFPEIFTWIAGWASAKPLAAHEMMTRLEAGEHPPTVLRDVVTRRIGLDAKSGNPEVSTSAQLAQELIARGHSIGYEITAHKAPVQVKTKSGPVTVDTIGEIDVSATGVHFEVARGGADKVQQIAKQHAPGADMNPEGVPVIIIAPDAHTNTAAKLSDTATNVYVVRTPKEAVALYEALRGGANETTIINRVVPAGERAANQVAKKATSLDTWRLWTELNDGLPIAHMTKGDIVKRSIARIEKTDPARAKQLKAELADANSKANEASYGGRIDELMRVTQDQHEEVIRAYEQEQVPWPKGETKPADHLRERSWAVRRIQELNQAMHDAGFETQMQEVLRMPSPAREDTLIALARATTKKDAQRIFDAALAPSGAPNQPPPPPPPPDSGRPPTPDAPTVRAPMPDAPTVKAPMPDAPTVKAPMPDAPTVKGPTPDAPTVKPAKPEEPNTRGSDAPTGKPAKPAEPNARPAAPKDKATTPAQPEPGTQRAQDVIPDYAPPVPVPVPQHQAWQSHVPDWWLKQTEWVSAMNGLPAPHRDAIIVGMKQRGLAGSTQAWGRIVELAKLPWFKNAREPQAIVDRVARLGQRIDRVDRVAEPGVAEAAESVLAVLWANGAEAIVKAKVSNDADLARWAYLRSQPAPDSPLAAVKLEYAADYIARSIAGRTPRNEWAWRRIQKIFEKDPTLLNGPDADKVVDWVDSLGIFPELKGTREQRVQQLDDYLRGDWFNAMSGDPYAFAPPDTANPSFATTSEPKQRAPRPQEPADNTDALRNQWAKGRRELQADWRKLATELSTARKNGDTAKVKELTPKVEAAFEKMKQADQAADTARTEDADTRAQARAKKRRDKTADVDPDVMRVLREDTKVALADVLAGPNADRVLAWLNGGRGTKREVKGGPLAEAAIGDRYPALAKTLSGASESEAIAIIAALENGPPSDRVAEWLGRLAESKAFSRERTDTGRARMAETIVALAKQTNSENGLIRDTASAALEAFTTHGADVAWAKLPANDPGLGAAALYRAAHPVKNAAEMAKVEYGAVLAEYHARGERPTKEMVWQRVFDSLMHASGGKVDKHVEAALLFFSDRGLFAEPMTAATVKARATELFAHPKTATALLAKPMEIAVPIGPKSPSNADVTAATKTFSAPADATAQAKARATLTEALLDPDIAIVSMTELGQGVNVSRKVRLSNGMEAIWKPVRGENMTHLRRNLEVDHQARREAAAYVIDSALGNIANAPPTVFRTLNGEEGALMVIVDGSEGGVPRGGHSVEVFDYVIGNLDRHGGNYMTTDAGVLVPIDHGLILPKQNGEQGYTNTLFHSQRALRPHELKAVRDFVTNPKRAEVTKKLRDLGISDESIAAMFERAQWLVDNQSMSKQWDQP